MRKRSAGFLFLRERKNSMNAEFDFDKMSGLIPAVVQDSGDGEVLMVGFMNRQALEYTLEKGYVTFFSRTRQQLWMKGESSGNRLKVVSAYTDCDRDTLLLRVEVEGAGVVCHRGTRSCFTEPVLEGISPTAIDLPGETR
jgi:phosphoribosyl-AMP cyclohydrolase